MSRVYHTHWNGGRPFQVEVCGNQVAVGVESDDGEQDYLDQVLVVSFQKIWIGESSEHKEQPRFRGNSILLLLDDLTYVWVGNIILTFEAFSPIVEFSSPVRGSDVPYAWARDEQGNTYLLLDFVVLPPEARWEESFDNPHHWWYDHELITSDRGRVPPQKPLHSNSADIAKFYCGKERFTCTCQVCPASFYDSLVSRFGPVSIKTSGGEKRPLSKEEYVQLMQDFMLARGWRKIQVQDIFVPPAYRTMLSSTFEA